MAAKSYAPLSILVLLIAFIYARWSILPTFYLNAPGRLTPINAVNSEGSYEVRFKHFIRNCEDIHLNEEEGWILLSCDPGRDKWNTVLGILEDSSTHPDAGIYMWTYREAPQSRPFKLQLDPVHEGADAFHPLGIEYHEESKRLFVINHNPSGTRLEWYKVDILSKTAKLEGTFRDAQNLPTPNALVAISENELLITNDHYMPIRDYRTLARLETYAGIAGGSIAHIHLGGSGSGSGSDNSPQITTLTRMPFANGIALLNKSTIAVASSSTASIRLFHVDWSQKTGNAAAAPSLTPLSSIPVPFLPDNLSADTKGTLLIAGHPHTPSVERVAKENRYCQVDPTSPMAEEDGKKCDPKLPKMSWVAEWSATAGLKNLYVGKDYGTASSVVKDWISGVGMVVGLYENGLMMWTLDKE